MNRDEIKAKVFISCGQRKDTDEVTIADQISTRLRQKGFDPYIAIRQQSLHGLKENIFQELSSSEYFIFIDFKREFISFEKESLSNDVENRGSLFCHQELALASYLDIPLIAFQEKGVKKNDGILQFLQANCTPFTDRNTLANLVSDYVDQESWKPNWKNQLVMETSSKQYEDAYVGQDNKLVRFFHIEVKNLNSHKNARNCFAFLKEIYNVANKQTTKVRSSEFKWAGHLLPNATILSESYRFLDGFHVYHEAPSEPKFNIFTDSGHFVPSINSPGEFNLTYIVVSDNFETITTTFNLKLSINIDDIIFEKI